MHALIRFLSHEITSVYSIASKSTALEGRNHSKITPKQCMINKRRVLTGPTIYSPSTESSSSLSSKCATISSPPRNGSASTMQEGEKNSPNFAEWT